MTSAQRVAKRYLDKMPPLRGGGGKQAAVDKIPLFNKFDIHLKKLDIIKTALKFYPNADPSTFKWGDKLESYPYKNDGLMFFNWFMQFKEGTPEFEAENYVSGSVKIALEKNGDIIRVYAFHNIDG